MAMVDGDGDIIIWVDGWTRKILFGRKLNCHTQNVSNTKRPALPHEATLTRANTSKYPSVKCIHEAERG